MSNAEQMLKEMHGDYTAWTGRTRTAQLTKKELKKKPCQLYESWEESNEDKT